MKVLLINGSPNEKGCTYTALNEVAAALNACQVETEIVGIGKKVLHGCIACGKCSELDKCIFDDDAVNILADKMAQADGLIIGSPVYFASPNGGLLAVLDRLFYSCKSFAHKPAAVVVSARRGGTTASLDALLKYPSIKQMPIVTSTYWPMVHGNRPEEVLQDKEGLQSMRNLGRNMAWMLKCIAAGKAQGIEVPVAEAGSRTNFIR